MEWGGFFSLNRQRGGDRSNLCTWEDLCGHFELRIDWRGLTLSVLWSRKDGSVGEEHILRCYARASIVGTRLLQTGRKNSRGFTGSNKEECAGKTVIRFGETDDPCSRW